MNTRYSGSGTALVAMSLAGAGRAEAAAVGPTERAASLPIAFTGALGAGSDMIFARAGSATSATGATSGGRGVFSAFSGLCGRRETGRGTAETLGLEVAGAVAASATASPPLASAGIDEGTAVTPGGELAVMVEPEPTDTADGGDDAPTATARGGDDAAGGDDARAGAALGAMLGDGGGAE